ncbi:MAG: FGGY-family carbohydrate kinase [Actinomycetia bacterium]|nr:FGGY-family carbohydrate kinase [Actinomycetes bacterium]
MSEPSHDGWILAIDLGNGGPKIAAVQRDGEIVATAQQPVAVQIELDGTATQDAREWVLALRRAVHELIQDDDVSVADLAAIAITAQWGSTVPVAADGEPAGPVLLWADTRARKHMGSVISGPLSIMGYAPHKVLPFIRKTGGAPGLNGADPTGHSLLLQNELSDVGARTVVQLEPADYLAFKLTGRAQATPASMSLSWITDNRPGKPAAYSADLVRRAQREPGKLPTLVPTGAVQGPLTPTAAAYFGLPAGVPVMSGMPDLHSAIVGSGAIEPFQTHLALSTTAWLSARVPFQKTDVFHSIGTLPGLDATHPLVANNIETGGAALQWLREQVIAPHDGLAGGGSGIGADGAAPAGAIPTFEDMLALAEAAPVGSEGVIFTPWLAGERSPVDDKDLRAAWLNLSLRSNRAIMIRSVLEGVALNIRWLLGPYQKFLGRDVTTIRILGGGAQSDLWCSILASTLGVTVERVANPRDAQLRGIALWARVCLGEISLSAAAALVPVDRVFAPVPAEQEIYDRNFSQYRKVYGKLKGVYRALNAHNRGG